MVKSAQSTKAQLAERLVKKADAYGKAHNLARVTVSKKCSGQAATIDRIASGENFTIELYDKCMAWLDENAPSDDAAQQEDCPQADQQGDGFQRVDQLV